MRGLWECENFRLSKIPWRKKPFLGELKITGSFLPLWAKAKIWPSGGTLFEKRETSRAFHGLMEFSGQFRNKRKKANFSKGRLSFIKMST